uniref:Ig-like domain-containing protein n=1 Tax=Oryzias latipes TaxID=8090 RepID=A0A3B3H6S6_ORYLA
MVRFWSFIYSIVFFNLSAFSSSWVVEYPQKETCAPKGSSVILQCSYNYSDSEIVESVKWGHKENFFHGPFVYDSESNKTSSRFTYSGDKKHNCSLTIDKVELGDAGKYAFRFITNSDKFTGEDGIMLKIDLNIAFNKAKGNEVIKGGDSASLTCTSSCDGGEPSQFMWLKDGKVIKKGPVLNLTDMSFKHSGDYCLKTGTMFGETTSQRVLLNNLSIGPKNTTVKVFPSEDVDAGTNVTLICSSHANPLVMNYTWFKKHGTNVTVLGEHHIYYFEKSSQMDDDQYFCRATNKHGSCNSSAVTIKIKGKQSHRFELKSVVCNYSDTFTTVALRLINRFTQFIFDKKIGIFCRFSKNRTTSTETDCEEETQVSLSLPPAESSDCFHM